MVVVDCASCPHSPWERITWSMVGIGAIWEHLTAAFAGFEVDYVVGYGEDVARLCWWEDWWWVCVWEEIGEGCAEAVGGLRREVFESRLDLSFGEFILKMGKGRGVSCYGWDPANGRFR